MLEQNQTNSFYQTDTIIALATPAGSGAIAVIRISGPQAIVLTNEVFKGKDICRAPAGVARAIMVSVW